MTHRTLDYEERLRAALRAAAESVEPDGGGLERIRARIHAPRPATAAWLATDVEPPGSVIDRLRSFPAAALRWLRPVTAGGAPAPYGWLRPLAAAAAFVLVVGSGALALTQHLTQSITQANSSSTIGPAQQQTQGNGGGQSGGGHTFGGGPSATVSSPSSSGGGTGAASSGSPAPSSPGAPSCNPNPTPGPTATGNPPVGSPSPSPFLISLRSLP